jgi:2-polyprenyl-6-methoxyphenol hydroxylase-like FAD-dependent oxidoreductase
MKTSVKRVVVLGCGIAGLLAAAAIHPYCETVVIVESDNLPDHPAHRPGTPQDKHVHALLAAGQDAIESILPGFHSALQQRGALFTDFAANVAIRSPAGWAPRFPSRLRAIGASRPLIEATLRDLVLQQPGITVLPRHRCIALNGNTCSIRTVHLRAADDARSHTLDADLVIDATGRGTRTDRWLAELGYPPPAVTRADARVGYATRSFHIPDGHLIDWLGCYILLHPRTGSRGAAVMAVENSCYLVTLIGAGPQRPTRHPDDFRAFAEALGSPEIAEIVRTGTPVTPIAVSTATSDIRRALEHSRRQPDNLLRIGDAACCFNPVYAQGMSTAALQAKLLAEVMARGDTTGTARRFHHDLARTTDGHGVQLCSPTGIGHHPRDRGRPRYTGPHSPTSTASSSQAPPTPASNSPSSKRSTCSPAPSHWPPRASRSKRCAAAPAHGWCSERRAAQKQRTTTVLETPTQEARIAQATCAGRQCAAQPRLRSARAGRVQRSSQ